MGLFNSVTDQITPSKSTDVIDTAADYLGDTFETASDYASDIGTTSQTYNLSGGEIEPYSSPGQAQIFMDKYTAADAENLGKDEDVTVELEKDWLGRGMTVTAYTEDGECVADSAPVDLVAEEVLEETTL